MFLIYILASITLFGAHLASAIDRKIKLHHTVGLTTSSEDIKG
jgi:uncharacterized BrkB/YihY/UPF0761 family membrane protein